MPSPVPLEIERTACCRIAEFPAAVAFERGDELAAFVAPFSAGLRGVLVLGMEPEAVQRLVAPVAGAAVPDAWREIADGVLAAVADRLGEAECAPGRLHDGSLVEAVVATHAPPDVAVLSATATVAGEPAALCVLLDAKELGVPDETETA